MKEYIEREAFRKQLVDRQITANFFDNAKRHEDGCIIEMLDSIPAADVVERKRGFWEGVDSSFWRWKPDGAHMIERVTYRCTRCGRGSAIRTNFCPSCGADMRKIEEE